MEFKLSKETLGLLKNSPVDMKRASKRKKSEMAPRNIYLSGGRVLNLNKVEEYLNKV